MRQRRRVRGAAVDVAAIVTIHRDQRRELSEQLFLALRHAIESERLRAGDLLPSTRALAKQLAIGRNAVVAAYDELLANGLVQPRVGSGTVVAARSDRRVDPTPRRHPRTTLRQPGESALRFATAAMRDALRESARIVQDDAVGAVAHLLALRGVRCNADEIALISSRGQALYLLLCVLAPENKRIYFEDPGDPAMRAACEAAGFVLQPMAVDQFGANVRTAARDGDAVTLAYVTPAHQMPLGVAMDAVRRRALLEWAQRTNGWLIEDDSTAWRRCPVSQPLYEPGERVLHAGLLPPSALAPFLDVAYVVAPPPLVERLRALAAAVGGEPSRVEQRVITRLISSGKLQRERRRMSFEAAHRDRVIVEATRRNLLWCAARITGTETGERAIVWLQSGFPCDLIVCRLRQHGIDASSLQPYSIVSSHHAMVINVRDVAESDMDSFFAAVATYARAASVA